MITYAETKKSQFFLENFFKKTEFLYQSLKSILEKGFETKSLVISCSVELWRFASKRQKKKGRKSIRIFFAAIHYSEVKNDNNSKISVPFFWTEQMSPN